MKRVFLCIAAGLVFVSAVQADEIHLKDGTKIIGTIVGYEKNSFRVKTAYGFAEVERSAVESITVSTAAKDEKEKSPAKPEKAKSEDVAKHEESAKSTDSHEVTTEKKTEIASAKVNPLAVSAVNFPSPVATAMTKPSATSPNATAPSVLTPSASTTQTATAAAPATPPETAPEPAPVKEEVRGNLYINDTYGFQMYKPPDWEVIAGARAALPGSIVAMGTSDQTTYLIIGLVPASGTLQAQIAATNDRLAGSFEGYQPEKIRDATIAGLPAHEYQFHGAANDKEWTGTVALIQRGGNFLTILGVTSTNTDLVQMEQNVISRTIASLQFTTP
ncbi:MAG TPA: hypothetical protein VGR72_00990 [Candidatus Acidoferrales bacterium]|nr:hypothetical protein [Candidatus Acidoferrales bacterium]